MAQLAVLALVTDEATIRPLPSPLGMLKGKALGVRALLVAVLAGIAAMAELAQDRVQSALRAVGLRPVTGMGREQQPLRLVAQPAVLRLVALGTYSGVGHGLLAVLGGPGGDVRHLQPVAIQTFLLFVTAGADARSAAGHRLMGLLHPTGGVRHRRPVAVGATRLAMTDQTPASALQRGAAMCFSPSTPMRTRFGLTVTGTTLLDRVALSAKLRPDAGELAVSLAPPFVMGHGEPMACIAESGAVARFTSCRAGARG